LAIEETSVAKERDLKFLLYRCQGCRRVLTKYQLAKFWDKAELAAAGATKNLCKCGGGRVSPTNASLWEELTSPAIWKVWWLDVVLPWWRSR
jgi:hypothetical protein